MIHARAPQRRKGRCIRAGVILVSLLLSLILACDMVARFASRPSVALVEMLSISSHEHSLSEVWNEFHEYLREVVN